MDENRVDLLNQDGWVPATPGMMGSYLKIDLNKADLVTYSLNKRFRQGENGTEVDFWFFDGSIPHSLDPAKSSVISYGIDALGKYKVVAADPQTDWQAGRVKMFFPSQSFAAAGQYQRMVIEVKNDDQIVATINFNIDVLPNDFYNINIGSQNFSGQIQQETYKKLTEFSEKAENIASDADIAINGFKGDYTKLKAEADDIKEIIDDNHIVTDAQFKSAINKLSSRKFSAADINWQDPFSAWNSAGGSSIAVHDGMVELSISTQSYASGSTVCVLPLIARPASEKIGVGLSMDGDGHDAQPIFVSITTDGRVIVQNNTHEHSKIVLVTNYTVNYTGNTGDGSIVINPGGDTGDTGNTGNTGTDTGNTGTADPGDGGTTDPTEVPDKPQQSTSIVKDITSASSGDQIVLPATTTSYHSDGSVARTLNARNAFIVDKKGTINGKNVGRIASDEWVFLSDVAYTTPSKGTLTVTTGGASSITDRYGVVSSKSYPSGSSYLYDKIMNSHDGIHTYYRIATDEWIDSADVSMGGSGSGQTGTNIPATSSVTGISNLNAQDQAGIYKTTTLYHSDGSVARTVTAGNNFTADKTGDLNGHSMMRVATDEWVMTADVAHSYYPGQGGTLTITRSPQTSHKGDGESFTATHSVGDSYSYTREMQVNGVVALRIGGDEYIETGYVSR